MLGWGGGGGDEKQGYRGSQRPFRKGTRYQTKAPGLSLVGQSFLNHTPWHTDGLLKKDW